MEERKRERGNGGGRVTGRRKRDILARDQIGFDDTCKLSISSFKSKDRGTYD
jgi:hypothetical protein